MHYSPHALIPAGWHSSLHHSLDHLNAFGHHSHTVFWTKTTQYVTCEQRSTQKKIPKTWRTPWIRRTWCLQVGHHRQQSSTTRDVPDLPSCHRLHMFYRWHTANGFVGPSPSARPSTSDRMGELGIERGGEETVCLTLTKCFICHNKRPAIVLRECYHCIQSKAFLIWHPCTLNVRYLAFGFFLFNCQFCIMKAI